MMKRLIPTIALLACVSASAQTLPTLLLTDKDARQAALCCPGEAAAAPVAALKADACAGRWVTSGISSTMLYAKAAGRLPSGLEASLSGSLILDKPYDITGENGVVTGQYEPEDYYIGLGVSYPFTDCLKAGLRARYICSYLGYGAVASAGGGDIFAMYVRKSFRASLEACNLGSGLEYGAGSYAQPSLARATACWSPFKWVLLAAGADCLFSGTVMAGAGAEFSIADMVFLRGGYHYGDGAGAIPSYATAGAGVKYKGISVDAVCILASQVLSGTAALKLGYEF